MNRKEHDECECFSEWNYEEPESSIPEEHYPNPFEEVFGG